MSKTVPEYTRAHGLLAGRTVLVTAAAGSGIGFATAKRCLEEGARVLISDIHERRLREASTALTAVAGTPVPTQVCNVTSESPSGRTVALSARRVEKDILVTVGGPLDGSPEAAGPEVLVPAANDRFVRRSDTGLGLALTRSLIELHGGEVNLNAEPGRSGVHAICRLPVGGPGPDAAAKGQGAG